MTEHAPRTPLPAGPVDPARDPALVPRTLTLSEERLTVSTEQVPVSTVRIERYQITETRTITVDVLVDRIRIITTPTGQQPQVVDNPPVSPNLGDIYQSVAGDAQPAPSAGQVSGWLVLSEEQVVVSKQSVPVERIQLTTTTVTQNRTVTEQLRAERLDEITMTDSVPNAPAS